ncbi:MAG: hypothetical protein AABY22_15855, partial [Nanoarchaeota archaeon]
MEKFYRNKIFQVKVLNTKDYETFLYKINSNLIELRKQFSQFKLEIPPIEIPPTQINLQTPSENEIISLSSSLTELKNFQSKLLQAIGELQRIGKFNPNYIQKVQGRVEIANQPIYNFNNILQQLQSIESSIKNIKIDPTNKIEIPKQIGLAESKAILKSGYQYRPREHNLVSEWDFLYNKAHNEYLNFAANSGTVGLAAYLVLVGSSIYLIVKLALKKNEKSETITLVAILAGYAGILVTNFFGFSVVITQLFLFIFPAMAVSLGSKEIEEDKTNILSFGQKFTN